MKTKWRNSVKRFLWGRSQWRPGILTVLGPLLGGVGGAVVGGAIGGTIGSAIGFAVGSYVGSLIFPTKSKIDMPKVAGYPVQQSAKGIPVAKVYGTCRVAGNVIWMGELESHTHKHKSGGKGGGGITTEEHHYHRSVLIGICEGPASISRIWKGKDEIPYVTIAGISGFIDKQGKHDYASDIAVYSGDDNSGIGTLIGEDYAEYASLCCVYFENLHLGSAQAIPNMVFEVSSFVVPLFIGKYAGNATDYTIVRHRSASEVATDWSTSGHFTITDLDAGQYILTCAAAITKDGGLLIGNEPAYDGLTMKLCEFWLSAGGDLVAGDTVTGSVGGGTATVVQISYYDAAHSRGVLFYNNLVGADFIHLEILDAGGGRTTKRLGNPAYNDSAQFTKLDINGAIDTSWGCEGHMPRTGGSYVTPGVLDIVIDKDGNSYCAAKSGYCTLISFDANGNVRWSRGESTVDYRYQSGLSGILLNADHSRLFAICNNDQQPGAAPYNFMRCVWCYKTSDGTLDTDWGELGVFRSPNQFGWAQNGALDEQGRLYVSVREVGAQADGNRYGLFRIKADGTMDTDFGYNGYGMPWYRCPTNGQSAYHTIQYYGGKLWVLCAPVNAGGSYDQDGLCVATVDTSTGAVTVVKDLATPGLNDKFKSISVFSSFFVVGGDSVLFDGVTAQVRLYHQDGTFIRAYTDDDASPSTYDVFVIVPITAEPTDVTFPDMILDALTDGRSGAGIAATPINFDTFEQLSAYCAANGFVGSLALSEQRPVLDWIDYICSHFRGFLYMADGKICLGMMRQQDSEFNLTQDDLVIEQGENPPPPVNIKKRPYSSTNNRVEITYTNRDADYDTSVATAQDEVDQRVHAKIRTQTYDLAGITSGALAQKMAYYMLMDSMYRFSHYIFTVAYKNMLLNVGSVGTLSDGHLISNQKIRILGVQEEKDGRGLIIDAIDEVDALYESLDYETQDTEREPDTSQTVTLDDGSLAFREGWDQAVLYLSVTPGGAECNGWFIYRSYAADSGYELIGSANIGGVTGGDANSQGTLTTVLGPAKAVTWRGDESFEVDIGTVTDLASASDTDFFNNRHLAKIGDEIIAYKTVEETAVEGIWTVTGLIRGLFGTDPVSHAVGATFQTLDVDFMYLYPEDDIGKTLYFKVLTFYSNNVQSLSDVSAISYQVQGEYKRPAPLSLLRNDDRPGFEDYDAASVTLAWYTASKKSGWNIGPFDYSGTPWKWGDSEALLTPQGGVPFGNFVYEKNIDALRLRIEQADEAHIKTIVLNDHEYEFADEKIAVTYAGDFSSNDPVRICGYLMTTLPASKEAVITLDKV